MALIVPGKTYYLAKDRMVELGHGRVERQQIDTLSNPEMLSISFDIDPSVSKITDENIKLAEYMKSQFLTVDIYNADSRFLFATAKLPMYELLRQCRESVVVAKEVEASAPDSAEWCCALQVIMDNQGK